VIASFNYVCRQLNILDIHDDLNYFCVVIPNIFCVSSLEKALCAYNAPKNISLILCLIDITVAFLDVLYRSPCDDICALCICYCDIIVNALIIVIVSNIGLALITILVKIIFLLVNYFVVIFFITRVCYIFVLRNTLIDAITLIGNDIIVYCIFIFYISLGGLFYAIFTSIFIFFKCFVNRFLYFIYILKDFLKDIYEFVTIRCNGCCTRDFWA